MRHLFAILTFVASVAVVAAAAPPQAVPAPASIAGTWVGKVTSDAGEMQITVAIKLEQGKANGSIQTAHGEWPIKDGTLKDGVWTLPFAVGGEGDRWMKGTVKGDDFTGEWNNAPMAVGTFELKRSK